jgi:hypothetical protein
VRRRVFRWRVARVAAVTTAALVLSGGAWLGPAVAGTDPSTGAGKPPTVIIYGDSLTTQSSLKIEARLSAELAGWRVLMRDWPGTALCDWLDRMLSDGDENAQLVLIQFSGNAFQTPGSCMLGHPDGTGRDRKYAADANNAAAIWAWRNVKVVFAASPAAVNPKLEATRHPLDRVYRRVARRWTAFGVTFTSKPELAVAERLKGEPSRWVFPRKLPCLPTEARRPECKGGEIQVRAYDGAHFCPVDSGDSPCRVYSSGVVRFADAMADAALARID